MPPREASPVYLTDAERDRLFAAAEHPRDRMALELLFYSGCRASEAIAASVGDLTTTGIRLRNLKRRDARAVKDVVLPRPFLETLTAFAAGMPLNAPLIAHKGDPTRGITRQQLGRIFHRAAAAAGIYKRRHPDDDFRVAWTHTARHSHAAHLVAAGVPLPVVADQLGHAGLGNMWAYSRLSDPKRAEYVNAAFAIAPAPTR